MQCFSNFTAYNTYVSSQKEIILTFSFLKDVKRPTTNATNMKQTRIFFAHIVLSPKHVFVATPVVAVFLHIYSVFINFPNAISSLSDICLTVHRRRRRVFLLPLSLLSLSPPFPSQRRRQDGKEGRGKFRQQAQSADTKTHRVKETAVVKSERSFLYSPVLNFCLEDHDSNSNSSNSNSSRPQLRNGGLLSQRQQQQQQPQQQLQQLLPLAPK